MGQAQQKPLSVEILIKGNLNRILSCHSLVRISSLQAPIMAKEKLRGYLLRFLQKRGEKHDFKFKERRGGTMTVYI